MVIKRQTYPRVRTGRVMPEAASDEIWLPVVGFEAFYEVSSEGRVRSLDRVVTQTTHHGVQTRKQAGRILKACGMRAGYLGLKLCVNGNYVTAHVAHLVAEAFIGPRPLGYQVCHNDGVPTNNRADNLRYDTISGNNADKARHGTVPRGENANRSKLTEPQVRAIREMAWKVPQRAIARHFGVSRGAITQILYGRTWGHVQ